jgi:hypothetical protein
MTQWDRPRDPAGTEAYLKLVELVRTRMVNHACVVCGAKTWEAISDPIVLSMAAQERSLPAATVPVSCKNCGYVYLFLCSRLEQQP